MTGGAIFSGLLRMGVLFSFSLREGGGGGGGVGGEGGIRIHRNTCQILIKDQKMQFGLINKDTYL